MSRTKESHMSMTTIELEYYDGACVKNIVISGNDLSVIHGNNFAGANKAIRIVQKYTKPTNDNSIVYSTQDVAYFTNVQWYVLKKDDITIVKTTQYQDLS